jgi:hypothetical protein
MVRKINILIFCLALGMYSCKKDAPPDYPSVQITAPYALAYFNVPGSIQVTGHVSDSKPLTSVTVYIANSGNIPVEETLNIPITSNNMNVSCSYLLNDIHMPGGEYYMTITASNGTHIASAFQQIYVDALPVKRTAIYAITRDGTGVHAWGIDSVFKVSPALSYTVPGDYSSSDVNSYYQQLYIAGQDSGNVNIYSVPNPSSEWNLTGSPSPSPYFTNVYCNHDAEFVSYFNHVSCCVKCYDHKGAVQSVYAAGTGYYPIKTFLLNNWLLTEEKSISSSQENLLIFYAASTAAYNQTVLPGPVVAMYQFDNNDVFLFGNNNSGGGYIKLYSIPNNTFYTPAFPLGSYGQLLSAAQINTNTYLISFSNGTIYQYTYNPIGILSYISGTTASTIRYDSINNQVITASGKTVNEYSYGSLPALINSVTISDSVRDLRVLYNK